MNRRDAKRWAHHIAAGLIERWLLVDWPPELPEGGLSNADARRLVEAMQALQHEHERHADARGAPGDGSKGREGVRG